MQNTTSGKGDFNLLGAMAGPNVRYGKNRYQNNFGQYKNYNTFRNVRGRQTNFQFGENNFQRNHFPQEAKTFEITDTQDIELETTNKTMPLIVHNTIILTMDHMDQETIILIQIKLTI